MIKKIDTNYSFSTQHSIALTFKEKVLLFFDKLIIHAVPQKREVAKEWYNGDKVIVIGNTEESMWTGEVIDEDNLIHDNYMPVFKDDKTGENMCSGGIFLKNDKDGIQLSALSKLDWNERWNLVSKGRAGVYTKTHYEKLNG